MASSPFERRSDKKLGRVAGGVGCQQCERRGTDDIVEYDGGDAPAFLQLHVAVSAHLLGASNERSARPEADVLLHPRKNASDVAAYAPTSGREGPTQIAPRQKRVSKLLV